MNRRRKTHEQFVNEVFELVGDEYSVLGDYIKSKIKILIRHNTCGHEYKVIPSDFLKGRRCPKCSRNSLKSDQKFKKEVYDLVGDEYTFLEEYKGANKKIKVRHNKCGNEYKVKPSSFLQGNRCPFCKFKKSNKQFLQEVFDLVGEEYTFLEEYVKSKSKIKVRHNKCGHEYEVTPNAFLKCSKCPKCSRNSLKSNVQFKQDIFDLVGYEYLFLEPYINAITKIKVRHNKCGYEYEVAPYSFLRGNRCPKCGIKNMTKTAEQFLQEVFDLVGNEYTDLDEYKNNHTKIKVRHNKCGYEYYVTPNAFLQGNRCPKCKNKMSKGEKRIINYLIKRKISFNYEHKFYNLKYINPLRFDFYLPDYNLCIEYDGIQHFTPFDFSSKCPERKNQNLKELKRKDKLKNDYCKSKGIKMLRIPYTEFDNINKILDEAIINIE